jgi:hypothetical protein
MDLSEVFNYTANSYSHLLSYLVILTHQLHTKDDKSCRN